MKKPKIRASSYWEQRAKELEQELARIRPRFEKYEAAAWFVYDDIASNLSEKAYNKLYEACESRAQRKDGRVPSMQIFFQSIKQAKAGDLCYDYLLGEFFIAREDELPDLYRRAISYKKVKDPGRLLKNFLPK
jgi:hypothetical protein